MKYLSVCSGIEAATVAWHPLDWEPVAFSEIDPFPSAVLAHHYPGVPNWGDTTKFQEWLDAAVDLLVGGTPCQSFSVAGLRAGLDDPRGSLMLTYLAIARRYRPRWVVWENVPGVLSADDGRAFGSLLGGLGELGYGFAYRVLDAQYFGLAQRRKRVFVVGHLGDWRRAAAVLFERESLSGHPAPRREAGQVATAVAGIGSYRGGIGRESDVAPCLQSSGGQDERGVRNALIAQVAPTVPARRSGGGGLGTDFDCDGGLIAAAIAIAFSAKDHGADAGDIAPTLRAGGHVGSHANGGVMPAVAFQTRGSNLDVGQISGTLGTNADRASGSAPMMMQHMAVRRLTPRECERLQGFPDDYTLIPYRGKPAADGPRYKSLGNSFAVPVVRWIGQRIQMVEDLCSSVNSVE